MINDNHIIKTERLILRPFELSDLASTHEYASDIENTRYMVWLPNIDINKTEQFLHKVTSEWMKKIPSFYEFAIVYNGIHIGAASISLDENRQEGELGWIINKNFQNKGFATEAAKAVLNFAINSLKINKIIAICDYRNAPSYRVMQKIGLILEREDNYRQYKDNRDNNDNIKELMYSLVVR